MSRKGQHLGSRLFRGDTLILHAGALVQTNSTPCHRVRNFMPASTRHPWCDRFDLIPADFTCTAAYRESFTIRRPVACIIHWDWRGQVKSQAEAYEEGSITNACRLPT